MVFFMLTLSRVRESSGAVQIRKKEIHLTIFFVYWHRTGEFGKLGQLHFKLHSQKNKEH